MTVWSVEWLAHAGAHAAVTDLRPLCVWNWMTDWSVDWSAHAGAHVAVTDLRPLCVSGTG